MKAIQVGNLFLQLILFKNWNKSFDTSVFANLDSISKLYDMISESCTKLGSPVFLTGTESYEGMRKQSRDKKITRKVKGHSNPDTQSTFYTKSSKHHNSVLC